MLIVVRKPRERLCDAQKIPAYDNWTVSKSTEAYTRLMLGLIFYCASYLILSLHYIVSDPRSRSPISNIFSHSSLRKNPGFSLYLDNFSGGIFIECSWRSWNVYHYRRHVFWQTSYSMAETCLQIRFFVSAYCHNYGKQRSNFGLQVSF